MEDNLLSRLLNGAKDFTERELSELTEYTIDTIEGESGRWTQQIESIIEVDGRLFSIDWDCGLTEYQESSFDNQPIEVKLVEEVKTIKIKNYIPLK